MSKLVIVESPAKAHTIQKYLGPDYEVMASMGHVRDLPASRMSVDVKNDFAPNYENIKGKGELIKKLRAEAKKSDYVYLATDPDREGEAISWHLAQLLKLDETEPNRVTFNEITKSGIKYGMEHPRCIDQQLVDAQQARRVLDRIVGYEISPFLWKKIRKGLSAGRVQSVAVRLVVDREDEIRAFKPEEYWTLEALLQKQGVKAKPFLAKYYGTGGKKCEITTEEQANALKAAAEKEPFIIEYKDGHAAEEPRAALYHLHFAAGCLPAVWLPGQAYHEGGAGAVRGHQPAGPGCGGLDHLYENRFAAHLR